MAAERALPVHGRAARPPRLRAGCRRPADRNRRRWNGIRDRQDRVWEPPARLVVGWCQASFAAGQETELHVRFDPLGDGTRVTVEHWGWDTIPPGHAARHGFPLDVFQLRLAEWWQALLASWKARTES